MKLEQILKTKTPDWEMQSLADPLVIEAVREWFEQKKKDVINNANSEDYKPQMNLLDSLEEELE